MNGNLLALGAVGVRVNGSPASPRVVRGLYMSAAAHLGIHSPPHLVRGPVARAQYRAIPNQIVVNMAWVKRVAAAYPDSFNDVIFGALAHELGHSLSRSSLLPRHRSDANRIVTEALADEISGLAMYRAGIDPTSFLSLLSRPPGRSNHPKVIARIEAVYRGFTAEMST